MIAKTITYTDYNNVERTETFYFNLTKTELAKMELSAAGGYADRVQRIIDAKDIPSLTNVLNDLILNSYGIKSEDGRRFIKSPQLSEEFSQTEAYNQLFMELITDDKKAANFVNGIVPADVAAAAEEEMKKRSGGIATDD